MNKRYYFCWNSRSILLPQNLYKLQPFFVMDINNAVSLFFSYFMSNLLRRNLLFEERISQGIHVRRKNALAATLGTLKT